MKTNISQKDMSKIICMSDFEKLFYPQSYKEKIIIKEDSPKDFGAKLAQQSIKKIKAKYS
jgi:hypothetical protein